MERVPANMSLGISVITWGEIAVGMPGDDFKQKEHLKFIHSAKPWVVGIDTHIAEEYGKLRGSLDLRKGHKGEVAVDRYTWLELGSLENDLWIAAQAIAKDLVLVTHDTRLVQLIVPAAGSGLHIEDWAT